MPPDFRANLKLYQDMYELNADLVAVDAHPGYFSAGIGRDLASRTGVETIAVQHHHAHVAAALAEHGFGPETRPVLGVVLDGLGYGLDGTIWGGEFLLADFRNFQRLAHFHPIALPGGEKANQQPWRNTLAHLNAVFGAGALDIIAQQYGELDLVSALRSKPVSLISKLIANDVNAVRASSAGRLFDAVAGALGIAFDQISFEGQAAMQLQALAETWEAGALPYRFETGPVIKWKGMWHDILADLKAGRAPSETAARFHSTLAACIVANARELAGYHRIETIVLTGGVFQNGLLLDKVTKQLGNTGLHVVTPQIFPANDGGLSLGQAAIAAARKSAA